MVSKGNSCPDKGDCHGPPRAVSAQRTVLGTSKGLVSQLPPLDHGHVVPGKLEMWEN